MIFFSLNVTGREKPDNDYKCVVGAGINSLISYIFNMIIHGLGE